MREPLRDKERLEHMLAAAERVIRYTSGKTFDDLKADDMMYYAVVKNIEIIGEAAYHLTKAFCKKHSETPWNDVMRMRNILVHDYYKIRLNEVWKVVQEDLQPLREQVTHYLAETNWEEWEKNEVVIVESAVHKNLIQSARRMKKDGMPMNQITRYTGLTEEEIEAL